MNKEEQEQKIHFIVNTFESMSKIVDKGSGKFLQTLGSGLIAIGLISKINLPIITFNQIEFITVMIIGLISAIIGSCIKFLEYKNQVKIQKKIWESGQNSLNNITEHHKNQIEQHNKNTGSIMNAPLES